MIERALTTADPVDGSASEGDKVRVQARAKTAAAVLIGATAGTLALGVATFAFASSAPAASALPTSTTSTTSITSATLAAFDADDAHRVLTAKYVERARRSLAQAGALRKSGDTTRADKADKAAATWAAAAAALVRAADAEVRATNVQLDTLDAGMRAERDRALLEESLATVGRRKAELARLEREKNEAPTHTTQTADVKESADGGATPRAHGSKGAAENDPTKDAGREKDWAPNAATAAP